MGICGGCSVNGDCFTDAKSVCAVGPQLYGKCVQCTEQAHCGANEYCSGTTCTRKLADAETCKNNEQCESGSCGEVAVEPVAAVKSANKRGGRNNGNFGGRPAKKELVCLAAPK